MPGCVFLVAGDRVLLAFLINKLRQKVFVLLRLTPEGFNAIIATETNQPALVDSGPAIFRQLFGHYRAHLIGGRVLIQGSAQPGWIWASCRCRFAGFASAVLVSRLFRRATCRERQNAAAHDDDGKHCKAVINATHIGIRVLRFNILNLVSKFQRRRLILPIHAHFASNQNAQRAQPLGPSGSATQGSRCPVVGFTDRLILVASFFLVLFLEERNGAEFDFLNRLQVVQDWLGILLPNLSVKMQRKAVRTFGVY